MTSNYIAYRKTWQLFLASVILPTAVFLSMFLTGFSLTAQAVWSRGEQKLAIIFPEAMRRADAGLRAEGYVNLHNEANFIAADKGIHTAVIMCNDAPNGGQWINIVVTSIACDGSIPGAERVRLQSRMDLSGNTSTNPTTAANGGAIDWNKEAGGYRGKNGERFTFTCPVNDYPGHRVYGTDIYTDDSSICTAAVHAGAIPLSGGLVTIEIRGPQNEFKSSNRNGIGSSPYGYWPGSFVIVR